VTDDALHAEIRRLRAALRRAEEDRDRLEKRLAYAQQQITELRAKVGGTMMQAAVPTEK
jgi:phage shock protein A